MNAPSAASRDSRPSVGPLQFGFRLAAIFVSVPVSYYLVICVPFLLFPPGGFLLPILFSLVWLAVVIWYVYWKRDLAPSRVGLGVLMGALLGLSVGLSIGFLAPICMLPIPDIAPLIGLFLVAPVCLLIGGLFGGLGAMDAS
jgi:hypothetical protein